MKNRKTTEKCCVMSIIILILHHSTAKIDSIKMAAKKTNKYNPGPRVNLISLSKKQDKLNKDIEHLRQLLNSTNRENDRHIEHLSNFVRHDMKYPRGRQGTYL